MRPQTSQAPVWAGEGAVPVRRDVTVELFLSVAGPASGDSGLSGSNSGSGEAQALKFLPASGCSCAGSWCHVITAPTEQGLQCREADSALISPPPRSLPGLHRPSTYPSIRSVNAY